MTRILFLVDQDRRIRLLYQERLAREGLTVITDRQRNSLLETIDGYEPDLIVMDAKRWKNLTASPPFSFDLKWVTSDYYFLKRSDSDGLNLEIIGAAEGEGKILELVLFMDENGTPKYF